MLKHKSYFKRSTDPENTFVPIVHDFMDEVAVISDETEFNPETMCREHKRVLKQVRPGDQLKSFHTRDFSMEVLQATGADASLRQSIVTTGERFSMDSAIQNETVNLEYDAAVKAASKPIEEKNDD